MSILVECVQVFLVPRCDQAPGGDLKACDLAFHCSTCTVGHKVWHSMYISDMLMMFMPSFMCISALFALFRGPNHFLMSLSVSVSSVLSLVFVSWCTVSRNHLEGSRYSL